MEISHGAAGYRVLFIGHIYGHGVVNDVPVYDFTADRDFFPGPVGEVTELSVAARFTFFQRRRRAGHIPYHAFFEHRLGQLAVYGRSGPYRRD